jgi:hypothetical protein
MLSSVNRDMQGKDTETSSGKGLPEAREHARIICVNLY